MALRLRIVSDHRRVLGERSTVVFSAPGGTIGRSADNDWVLPDPQRYISAHHARVQCRSDGYFLEDLSTNGVYVNDGDRPLAKLGPYRLRNGDLLRFGDYHVIVAIENGSAGAIQPASTPESTPTSIDTLQNLGRAAQTDIGASLNLDDLLVSDPQTNSDSFRLVNAFGQAVNSPKTPAEEAEDEVVARRIARLAKAAARSQSLRENNARPPATPAALFDVQSGLQAFCRGAGMEMERLPADAQTRLLHLAGQLFREALVGLKDLERSQQEVRNRFRIELPVSEDSRPSLAKTVAIEDVLIDIFSQHESRRLDAVQWLRETIDMNKTHGTVSAQAMRTAFADFIGRLNPAELESRFQRAGRRNMLSGSSAARYWELFSEFYKNLCEMPADTLPHTFVEAFANAYKQLLSEPEK
jgi:type VI secretion system protein